MKLTPHKIYKKKSKKEKITSLTAYDFPFARIFDESGIDIILIGDSLGMVLRGHKNTRGVGMEDMLYHTQAVSSAVEKALVIADMPYKSFETSQKAVKNAKVLMKKGGAGGVKIEGGLEIKSQLLALKKAKIPVMGHVGMTPQKAKSIADFKVRGKTPASAKKILEDALLLDELGVFSIVLECIPSSLAKQITESVSCPTIGIGAGKYVDGQILVGYDLLGIRSGVSPKFVRQYAALEKQISSAAKSFKKDVQGKKFPSAKESF